ncbi:HAMP domain-containing histidine kinase [Streptomyces sp. NBC_00659]|uniref:sensor histidine kinase n=1 Tax=Streptomyces sp. NBC_00659 TaxID=2903669 RepID=UPI002E3059E3|nr:HAMP domain-containing sensor histidine kinase [Streptomyces sp. NBC_00659]
MTDASAGAHRPAPHGTRPRPAPPGRLRWRASRTTSGWPALGGVRWRLAPRSIRWRLTLLYSALFVVAGAALLGFTYLLASRTAPSTAVGGSSFAPGQPGGEGQTPDPPTLTMYAEALRADQLHQLLVEAGVALAVMTFASVALGWLMAGRVLAPLRTMTSAARRISADNLRQRLAVPGPEDELKAMADTFDDVLGRLEGAFEAQKQFVANASHELRTPLTLQQAIVDVALADPGASVESLRAACLRVRAAGQEQERLIDALLTLARSQRGLQCREFVDLAETVRELLPDGGPGTGGPRVRADLGSAPVLGDPQLIERLVVNLADNAVRHNTLGDQESWVQLWTGTEAGRPVLRIDNTGPVIPHDQVAGLFQPFRRLGAERTGTHPRGKGRPRDGLGLGLSIVTAVATAHGGTVEAWPRPRGGLSVRVAFPPCAPPASRPGQAQGRGRAAVARAEFPEPRETDRQGVGPTGD